MCATVISFALMLRSGQCGNIRCLEDTVVSLYLLFVFSCLCPRLIDLLSRAESVKLQSLTIAGGARITLLNQASVHFPESRSEKELQVATSQPPRGNAGVFTVAQPPLTIISVQLLTRCRTLLSIEMPEGSFMNRTTLQQD
jgi:hypothetical protein